MGRTRYDLLLSSGLLFGADCKSWWATPCPVVWGGFFLLYGTVQQRCHVTCNLFLIGMVGTSKGRMTRLPVYSTRTVTQNAHEWGPGHGVLVHAPGASPTPCIPERPLGTRCLQCQIKTHVCRFAALNWRGSMILPYCMQTAGLQQPCDPVPCTSRRHRASAPRQRYAYSGSKKSDMHYFS